MGIMARFEIDAQTGFHNFGGEYKEGLNTWRAQNSNNRYNKKNKVYDLLRSHDFIETEYGIRPLKPKVTGEADKSTNSTRGKAMVNKMMKRIDLCCRRDR